MHHARGLLRLTNNPALVAALQQDYRSADISTRQRAMLDYADKLTRDPGALRAADMLALRAAGLDDRSILDLNQTVSYFAYVNRVADGLGVTVDEYALS